MKRIIATFVLLICLFSFSACSEKAPTDHDWKIMRNAILHEYNDYLKTIKGDTVFTRCPNGLTFDLSSLGIEFYEMTTSHASFYIPKSEVSSSTFKDYVKQISEVLGEPNASTAFFAQWTSEDKSYSLSIAYNSDIYNCFGVKVE